MSFKFKDLLNRPSIIVITIAAYLFMLVFGLVAKVYKLSNVETVPAWLIIGSMFYFIHELKFRMELKLSERGVSYCGKKSKWIKFKPDSRKYLWAEVTSISFHNGLKIITVNFTDGEKIRFFAEPDKSQNFFEIIGKFCPFKVDSQEEVAAYLRRLPSMATEYDSSLFRGLSIGMPILFIGIALLLLFVLFVVIKQTP